MKRGKTVVMGASNKPHRYAYLAVNRLVSKGEEVVALGNRAGSIGETPIITEWEAIDNVDTITLYLNPSRQKEYYAYILSLKPRRVIFNPGTENPELITLLKENGIEAEIACTLVLLATDDY